MSEKLVTALKYMCAPMALAGTGCLLMGIGIVPADPDLVTLAELFIQPLHIPVKPFFVVLGVSKILAIGKLTFGVGPLPKSVALGGLAFAASCAAIGHHQLGDGAVKVVPALGTVVSLGIIAMFDTNDNPKEEKKEQ